MAPTNTAQKKVNSTSSASKPSVNGDHRKKPRNRTTRSCLNCHTSKRMCDRKRPACSRCSQLGLTGICIYEVDDPKQRNEANEDQSARLLKRVAELEGVVRELKNKPHPRWLHSSRTQEDSDKGEASPSATSSPASGGDSSSNGSGCHNPRRTELPQPIQTGFPLFPSNSQSGSTTPSSAVLTPSDEFPNPFSSVTVSDRASSSPEYDLTAMSLGTIESTFGSAGAFGPDKQILQAHGSHCGCLHDPTSYRTMLELSLGLRRAASILRNSPSHQLGGFCPLHQGVLELDSLAMDTLSSPFSSRRVLPTPAHRVPSANPRPWDIFSLNANSPSSLDDSDSFMTWEPHRS
ncbi:hypothetical protein CPB84DRAFT_1311922 [Gymnopilus junonius]|uniref:Zn(2)-C6 fungal-type domain-containing protein n=1 Tax=Gymnopilus junonius TaxID=109634 RepID=A0A9P5NJW9_GYMJU|nr:hypothetical protein CPB84DRAFT_1311922 [Gymnopilus junonius]